MHKIPLDEGWSFVEKAFERLVHVVDYGAKDVFTMDDYMMLYTTVYGMCLQVKGDRFVYAGYTSLLKGYLQNQVLPSLHQKHGFYLLDELVKRWSCYLELVRGLRFFCYVDHHYTAHFKVPTLKDASLECFRELVYAAVERRAEHAFVALMHGEYCGHHQIDWTFVRKAHEFFIAMRPQNQDFITKLESLKNVDELSGLLANATMNAI